SFKKIKRSRGKLAPTGRLPFSPPKTVHARFKIKQNAHHPYKNTTRYVHFEHPSLLLLPAFIQHVAT
ncbi:hypothetical protein, partial [Pseudomonas helleri]|uniref:hypothetical protein n=2 Tax=Pseudomonas helleri TaxID=1608996 RepID=UPI003D112DDE